MSATIQQLDRRPRSPGAIPPTAIPPAHPAEDDPTAWNPYEHHDDPDEVPHDVVGILAFMIVVMTIFTGLLWLVFGPVTAAIAGTVFAVWAIVRLSHRARRERIEQRQS